MTISSIYEKPTGAKAQNVDWITDTTPLQEASTIIIQVAISSSVILEVTLDGTTYDSINEGTALTADTLYRFAIDVDDTMTFNIRTADAAGVTITQCLIKESPVVFT